MPPLKSIKIKIKKIKIPKRSEEDGADREVEVEKEVEEIHARILVPVREKDTLEKKVEVEVIIDIKRDLGPSRGPMERSILIDPDQMKNFRLVIKMSLV